MGASGRATRLALTLALALAPALALRAPGDNRPNVVLFYPDTLRAEAFGTYGHPLSKTPNFDALASQGVTFESAHVQHTQCAPSRCALFTGRYMHVLGHRTQTHLVRSYEDNLFKYLKRANYTTILLGKNDVLAADSFNSSLSFWQGTIGVSEGPSNFTRPGRAGYYSFAGTAGPCKGTNAACNGDLKAVEDSVAFFNSGDSLPEPFFLFLPGIGAHPPYGAPSDFFASYTSDQVRAAAPLRQLVPGNAKPGHLQPTGITGFRNLTSFHDEGDDELFYELAAVYLGRIAYVDYVLGVLMRGLDASPIVGRTALIAHSDHGDYGGDWQAVEKWPGAVDDVLTRVPLLARVPGGAGGLRVATPVMSIDLMPTILELAGIALSNISSVQFGVSLLPWLVNGTAPANPHKWVFSEGGYSNWMEYEPASTQTHPTHPPARPPLTLDNPSWALGNLSRPSTERPAAGVYVRGPHKPLLPAWP